MDYKTMQVGDRTPMPVRTKWEGANQALFREVAAWCSAQDPHPQFQVESVRDAEGDIDYWLERIR